MAAQADPASGLAIARDGEQHAEPPALVHSPDTAEQAERRCFDVISQLTCCCGGAL